jgi:hypothetical protein
MKTKLAAATALTLLLTISVMAVNLNAAPQRLKPGLDFSGPHFNLNVHGVPYGTEIYKFKNDSIGPGRHSIFVPLNTIDNITIFFGFSQTMNWTVLDCDATGPGGDARIVLPAYMYIDTNSDGVEDTAKRVAYYMVYVVGLGKPSDAALWIIYPQVAYNASWTAYQFSQDQLTVPAHMKGGKGKNGQPVWYNATNLFFADVTFWNGTSYLYYQDTWVFDIPGLEDYWWNVQNTGVRLMQLRFYPVFK